MEKMGKNIHPVDQATVQELINDMLFVGIAERARQVLRVPITDIETEEQARELARQIGEALVAERQEITTEALRGAAIYDALENAAGAAHPPRR